MKRIALALTIIGALALGAAQAQANHPRSYGPPHRSHYRYAPPRYHGPPPRYHGPYRRPVYVVPAPVYPYPYHYPPAGGFYYHGGGFSFGFGF